MKRQVKVRIQKQTGFTLLPVAMTVAIFSFISIQLIPIRQSASDYVSRTATVAGINELAAAAKASYVDPSNPNQGTWPASPQVLRANLYLAGFQNINGYGFPYSFSDSGGTFIITTTTENETQAREIASHFGGLASVSANEVSVAWSRPGYESSHDELVHRDGSRDVFGTIIHRAGGSAGIVLNGNDIDSAGTVGADTLESDLIDSDIGSINTLTVNEFRITP